MFWIWRILNIYIVLNNMVELLLCYFIDFMYKYGYMWLFIESGVNIYYFIIIDYDLLE